jgi:hypothetical protein
MITIEGKLIDVGNLEYGRGFMVEVAGQDVTVTGLTEEEVKNVARHLGQRLTITVSADNGTASHD